MTPGSLGWTTQPARVVQVVRSDGFAGVERYIADVSGELARRGWAVDVVGGDPLRMVAALPSEVRFRPARSTLEVARQLWALGPTPVVHAHMTAAELPAAVLARRHRGRLVVTRHFAGRRGSSPLSRVAGRLYSRRIDCEIATSAFVADAVESETVVLHSGVAPSVLTQAVERDRTVVVLQRIEAEKDPLVVIDAWQVSGLAELGWRLVWFGSGALEPAVRRRAERFGLGSGVRLAGVTDSPREELSRAGMVLATTPREAFGLAVVEAMAEGTPVVAADQGAHRETLGPLGRYFPPGDAEQAGRQLRELALAAPGERAELGSLLRARHGELFTVERHVDGLERLYAQPGR